MVDLSHLFSFAYFSLTDFIFWSDKNKKNNDKKRQNDKHEKKLIVKRIIIKIPLKINFLKKKKC